MSGTRYIIGPGLMVSLNDILVIIKKGNEIVVVNNENVKQSAKFQSEEEADSQFTKISADLAKHNFIPILDNKELISAGRIRDMYHEPRIKYGFCFCTEKIIGEKVIVDFTFSSVRWCYYFETEDDAVAWMNTRMTLLK